MVELAKEGVQLPLPPAKLQAPLTIHVGFHLAQFAKHLAICARERPLDFPDFVAGKLKNHSLTPRGYTK